MKVFSNVSVKNIFIKNNYYNNKKFKIRIFLVIATKPIKPFK